LPQQSPVVDGGGMYYYPTKRQGDEPGETESHDPDELLVKYRKLQAEVDATREALKRELMGCLGRKK